MIYPMIDPLKQRTPTAIETIEDQPHDQQQLRQRLLQLIVKSEAKRRSAAQPKILPVNRQAAPRPRSIRAKFPANRTAKKRA
jgi:hypothetical protein